jgi:site-specific DNA-methyltransferase (adenine-specific)
MHALYLGDCREVAKCLNDDSIQTIITSPPYAEQRKKLYGGIPAENFPGWTCSWMNAFRKKLKNNGSIFIVIRPHIEDGQISDYVLKTRLAVREAGWIECEELIWFKSDAPPLGSTKRPRRAWESILWFSQLKNPFCDLKACGNEQSTRTGGFQGSDRFGQGGDSPIAAKQNRILKEGTSRCSDVIRATIATIPRGVKHPAMFPAGVPEFLIKTFSKEGDLILDPFCGSSQTGIAALNNNRNYIGIDNFPEYIEISKNRLTSHTKCC